MRDGIDVSDAKCYVEDVARVGPGGHYLMEDSTLAACRSEEFLQPRLVDRNAFERWEELGRPDMYSQARKRVDEILAGPLKAPLPGDVAEKLAGILRRADAEL